jgi:hypothetical protein
MPWLLKDGFADQKQTCYLYPMLKISQLFIYPIKSLGGIAVDKAHVTDRGFEHDRRWMLVDENNLFISQREVHEMALMRVAVTADGLLVRHLMKNSSFLVPFEPQTGEFPEVTIWDDTCTGQFVSKEADQWFSSTLGVHCRLVYMPDGTRRITDQRYARENSIVSFADGYPFLLISQASLDDLNSRLEQSLPMDRFRPSIVFTGGEPFSEDLMHTLSINEILFHGVKLCARCPIPTIDQQTGQQGKEPSKTLAKYRFKNNKIYFGQNLIHEGLGEIAVGDNIEVLQWNTEERFKIDI